MKNQPTTSAATIESTPVAVDSTYHLKWIQWNSGKIPIVMQSKNGPCPLIATMNVLLLREKVKLPPMLEQITADQLLTYLGECIMDCMPAEMQNDENAILNLEQNIHDAIEILPKLNTGLDVNIRFTGITDFEYTPECIVFDLLRIPLYHGWLSDPSLEELRNAIGTQSYNQLVDNIITNKTTSDPETMAKVFVAEEFLERTASQLTEHGLNELKSQIKDNEIGILFRNNHFLTLFKREGEIYTLVTDHGYLTEDNIIWETLDNIEGAGRFFDSNFQLSEITNKQISEFQTIGQKQQQLENDFLMALSLREEEKLNRIAVNATDETPMGATAISEPENDFELAQRLQWEENRIYEISNEVRRDSVSQCRRPSLTKEDSKEILQDTGPTDSQNDNKEQCQSSSNDTGRRWAEVVSDGPVLQPAFALKPGDAAQIRSDSFRQTNEETSQTTQTHTDTVRPEYDTKQLRVGRNVDPSSSTSHPGTRRAEMPQHHAQTRSSSNTNRRSRGDKNSKDINCVVH